WNEGHGIEPSAHHGMHKVRENAATDVQERPRVKVRDKHNTLDIIGAFLAKRKSCRFNFGLNAQLIQVRLNFTVFTLKPICQKRPKHADRREAYGSLAINLNDGDQSKGEC